MSFHRLIFDLKNVENVARGLSANAYFGARQWGQKGPRPIQKKHPRKLNVSHSSLTLEYL